MEIGIVEYGKLLIAGQLWKPLRCILRTMPVVFPIEEIKVSTPARRFRMDRSNWFSIHFTQPFPYPRNPPCSLEISIRTWIICLNHQHIMSAGCGHDESALGELLAAHVGEIDIVAIELG